MFYDWASDANPPTDDPRWSASERLPYGNWKVTLNGCDVSALLTRYAETGPKGCITFHVRGANGEFIEYPRGCALVATLHGNVTVDRVEPVEADTPVVREK